MDVSVIIINYNTRQTTADCIASVREKTSGISYEIILVDNASTDGSKEFFETFPGITYIYSPENLGFGRANNLGYKYAKGEYVLLLNSDTLLVNNAVKILKNFLDKNPDKAIVGGQLINVDSLPIHSYSLLFPSIKYELDRLIFFVISRYAYFARKSWLKRNGYMRVAYITGADLMLRRKDIEQLGMFNPQFFMYFEETEMQFRYNRNRKYSYFCPDAQIIHLESASFKVSELKDNLFFRSRNIYYSNIFPTWKKKIADLIYATICVSRIVFNLLNAQKRQFWVTRYSIFKKYS